MAGRTPPHNPDVEAAVLGACLLNPAAVEVLATECGPWDFYVPAHRTVASAILDMAKVGQKVDPVTVADRLTRVRSSDGIVGKTALDELGGTGFLMDLEAKVTSTSHTPAHVATLIDDATARSLIDAGTEIAELGWARPDDIAGAVDTARSFVTSIGVPSAAVPPARDLDEFLSSTETYDWLIPGLLERMDRLMLTGIEGLGKSTFLRQLAVQVAAGIVPFTNRTATPRRVLLIDLENAEPLIRRKLRPMVVQARQGGEVDPTNLRIECRPGGIDVLSRADHRWLFGIVQASRPDLLVMGPIYKLYDDDPTEEQPARRVAAALDQLRERFGVTLILEAHAPHGPSSATRELRPYGASLWKRWPEFGYGLRPKDGQFHLEPWRGARDERDWPEALQRGGHYPWTAVAARSEVAAP